MNNLIGSTVFIATDLQKNARSDSQVWTEPSLLSDLDWGPPFGGAILKPKSSRKHFYSYSSFILIFWSWDLLELSLLLLLHSIKSWISHCEGLFEVIREQLYGDVFSQSACL